MRLHFFGHSAFLAESGGGGRVIFDPYTAGGYGDTFRYKPVGEDADLVLVSHGHKDHADPGAVKGSPAVLDSSGIYEAAGGHFKCVGVESVHDAHGGAERGMNLIWRIEIDGIRVVHLGDLGDASLSDAQAGAIGPVDVLMVPVGGHFTIDALGAHRVVDRLAARAVVPMHYRTDRVDFPIAGVEPFLDTAHPVVRIGGPDLYLSLGDLPAVTTIYVLEPSR